MFGLCKCIEQLKLCLHQYTGHKIQVTDTKNVNEKKKFNIEQSINRLNKNSNLECKDFNYSFCKKKKK